MKEADTEFDLFTFAALREAAEAVPEPPPVEVPEHLSESEQRQLSLAFLAAQHPAAVAGMVPIRRCRLKVDAACFWRSDSVRRAGIGRTAVVVRYPSLDGCFSDCAGVVERMERLAELRARRLEMEAEIREKEPELAATDELFSEFRSWDYASSTNVAYHRLCRRISREAAALISGSRLERIRRSGVADYCFLALPEEVVIPEEFAPGWGVIFYAAPRRITLLRPAELQPDATPEGRLLLALNIAAAATGGECLRAGVDRGDGAPQLRRRARRGRLEGKVRLPDEAVMNRGEAGRR